MDTAPFIVPSYSTATMILVGLLVGTLFLAAIISVVYWINTRMRRGMKTTHDDWQVEQDIESGHTLHAEGLYGNRHPEEGGRHLKQEDPHSSFAALKPGLTHKRPRETVDKTSDSDQNRNIF